MSLVIFFFMELPCFIEVHVFNEKSVGPGQSACSVAFDQGLCCLLMSLLGDAKYINIC